MGAYTTSWAAGMLERAVKTAAQTAIPLIAATSLDAIDWRAAALTVLAATLLSVLTSIADPARADTAVATATTATVDVDAAQAAADAATVTVPAEDATPGAHAAGEDVEAEAAAQAETIMGALG